MNTAQAFPTHSASRRTPAVVALLVLGVAAPGIRAQTAAAGPTETLPVASRTAIAARPFALVRGLRELSDGRVVVTDWIEEHVIVFQPGLSAGRVVGRPGAGPGEYRLPTALYPWRADSTLLLDTGNGRLAILDPEGRVARTLPADQAGLGSPVGADDRGRLYYTIPPWARGVDPSPPDSTAVMRLEPISDNATRVAYVRGITPRRDRRPRRTPGLPFVPFAPQDGVRVTAGGVLVVLRADRYALERIGPSRRTIGPSYAFATDPVTGRDQRAFVAAFLQQSPISGRGPDGGLGHAPPATAAEIDRMTRTNEFATRLPHFDAGGVFLGPDEEVWALRGRHAGQPATYDRFGPSGVLIGTVRLDSARLVVGLGRGHVYVAATDADGLQALEQYARPN